MHWNTQVADAEGDEWLSGLRLHRRDSGLEEHLPVRGMFYAIGHTPNTELVRDQLQCDGTGYLITQPGRPETSKEGVFAAGDVADAEWTPVESDSVSEPDAVDFEEAPAGEDLRGELTPHKPPTHEISPEEPSRDDSSP